MEAPRNAPCPCGSGKKFKHCHGAAAMRRPEPEDAVWRKIRRALDGYPAMMLRFIDRAFGHSAIHEAWNEFLCWPSEDPVPFEADSHLEVFMPWFFHHWAPDPLNTSVADESLHGHSATAVLLERRASRVDPVLRRYLEACLAAPFSFHEVLRSDPGRGMRTRDLFTGVEFEVLERSASGSFRRGDAFFGQIIQTDGIAMLEACGRYAIPPRMKPELIEFRERIASEESVPADLLKEWDFEIRDVYFYFVDLIENPSPMRIQNTDGEDLVFHRMFFDIDSPREAVAALADLTLDETEDDLLKLAEFGPDGELRKVEFAWKVAGNASLSLSNTVNGHIEIDGRALRAEANSPTRAAKLRSMIEDRLGDRIRHDRTEIETLEEAMERAPSPAPSPDEAPPVDSPEVRELMRQVLSAHYDRWVSEPIPALGGQTPMEAVRDRVGREKVEALVTGMERGGASGTHTVEPEIFMRLRERLGLPNPDAERP